MTEMRREKGRTEPTILMASPFEPQELGAIVVLSISSVSPSSGWAGTILEILGSDFAPDRDSNQVDINGTVGLVLEAASSRLLVQTGAGTTVNDN